MRPIVAIAILVGVTLAVFWPVAGHDFIGIDDPVMVSRNPDLNRPTVAGVWRYWQSSSRALYMPMTYTVWALTSAQTNSPAGPSPRWFHIVSIAVHLLTVLAVWKLLEQLFADHRAAVLGALLFAVHPMQVESVAWVSETKDLLAGLFSTGAFCLYVRFAKSASGGSGQSQYAKLFYILAMIAFALAMLSKPSALIIPLVAAAIDAMILRRSATQIAAALLPWIVLAFPFALIAQAAQHGAFEPVTGAERAIALWWRPIVAADATWFYFCKLVWPANLAIDYGRSPWFVMDQPSVWLTASATGAIGFTLWLSRSRLGGLTIGGAVMCIALLPVLGLVPFDFQEKSTVADHYMYLAMLGPALAAAWALLQWPSKASVTIALLVLAVFVLRSRAQTRHWRDSQAVYRHGLAINPQSWWLSHSLGYDLLTQEKPADAIPPLRRAVELAPMHAAAQAHLGAALAETGQFREAVERLELSLTIDPFQPNVMMLLGDVHMLRQQFPEALLRYRAAMNADPDLPGLRERLQRAATAAEEQ